MKVLSSIATSTVVILITTTAWAQSFRITVDTTDAICLSANKGSAPTYDLSVVGDSITGKAGLTTFSGKVGADGTFKTSFKSARGNAEMIVEGNTTPGHRTLKIVNSQMGCKYEGKE